MSIFKKLKKIFKENYCTDCKRFYECYITVEKHEAVPESLRKYLNAFTARSICINNDKMYYKSK